MDGFYIAPAFMDKLVVHITKNFLTLPNIKVLIRVFHLSIFWCNFELLHNFIDLEMLCFFCRFHLFWVSGEAKVKVNPSSVSLSWPRWVSSESISQTPISTLLPFCSYRQKSKKKVETFLQPNHDECWRA